jgi:hypothetical protein
MERLIFVCKINKKEEKENKRVEKYSLSLQWLFLSKERPKFTSQL